MHITYDASRYVEKLRPTIRNHVNEVRTRCAHQVSQNSQLPVRSLRLSTQRLRHNSASVARPCAAAGRHAARLQARQPA